MPLSRPSPTLPAWSDQEQFENFRRGLQLSSVPYHKSKDNSMLSAFKSTFKRKNSVSASSISSRGSAASCENRTTDQAYAELAADAQRLSIGSDRRSRSRSPASGGQAPDPFPGLSPPTRRPDRPGMNAFTVSSNEPPPAYTASPVSPNLVIPSPVESISPPAATTDQPAPVTGEDKYAFLTHFDTLLLIDDSGSMAGRSWRETSTALAALLPIITTRDADGIDLHFLNHLSLDPGDPSSGVPSGGYRNVRSAAEVTSIFQRVRPAAGTPTGVRLRHILRPYVSNLEREKARGPTCMDAVKPLNVLVITDGVPNDDVESVLLEAARKLDALEAAPHQIGVQFFQVGNEEGAAEALRELDDGLVALVEGGVRDMVDTCTWMGGPAEEGSEARMLTAEGILKVVLGAVVKRLDRRRMSVELRR